MKIIFLTAAGVGGATIFGALIGFALKNFSIKFSNIILSFAAGVMLPASFLGLIMPSLEYGGRFGVLIATLGIFVGALSVDLMDKLLPKIRRAIAKDAPQNGTKTKLDRVLLFVGAIAIHNLPEGIAAGVGFGTGDVNQALLIAGGIALQNIPEGMVIIGPMLASGISPARTLAIAALTGVIEIFGTVLGYFAVNVAYAALPFALSFAGGAMLYVICSEMIPETQSDLNPRPSTFSLLAGFCLMLITSTLV